MDILSIITDEIERLRPHTVSSSNFKGACDKLLLVTNLLNETPVSGNRQLTMDRAWEFNLCVAQINAIVSEDQFFAFQLGVKDDSIYLISMDLAKGYNE